MEAVLDENRTREMAREPWAKKPAMLGAQTLITGDWHVLRDSDRIMMNPAAHKLESTQLLNRETPPHIPVRLPAARSCFRSPALLLGSYPNFYHSLVDYAMNWFYAHAEIRAGRDILVGSPILGFQKAIMDFAGVPHEALRDVEPNMLLECDDLAVLPRSVQRIGKVFDTGPSAWMRERALALDGPVSGKRRIYVSRALYGRRAVANEVAVLDALTPFGFEVHQLETLSFETQAQLFSGAELLVGPHGAGFANMIFMPPGAAVVEIMPTGTSALYFKRLAEGTGLRLTRVLGGRLTKRDGRGSSFHSKALSSFPVDPELVTAAVRAMLDQL